jgi:hypothetical protein
MRGVEIFLTLLFGAIVVMLIVTNGSGVNQALQGLGSFTGNTVSAFRGGFTTG